MRSLPRSLQVRGINNYFEKYGIVTHVSVVIQFLNGAEHRAATGDVAFTSWYLERWAIWIRCERINHVFHIVLIQQHEGHPLSEWPAEYRVILTTHDNKEQGDMCASPQDRKSVV